MKKAVISLFLLCLTLAAALAGTLVCSKCGYENADTREACTHCEAKLVAPEATPERNAPVETGDRAVKAPAFVLDTQVVTEEVAAGKEALVSGDIAVARLFFRNAGALDLLRNHSSEGALSEEIGKLITQCDTSVRMVKRKCPACDGSGKKQMTITSLSGEVSYRDVPGRSCPACEGRGAVLGRGTVDEQKYTLGRAERRYRVQQRARRCVAVGEAWVPSDVEEKLSFSQLATLRRATARPCEECSGIGRISCEECRGTGRVKCPVRGCQNGMVEKERGGQLGGTGIVGKERCATCDGRGEIACEVCRGAGSSVCPKCNGSGERPACRKCGGTGTVVCRQCKGAGEHKGQPCVACRQEGVTLCTACGGDSRK